MPQNPFDIRIPNLEKSSLLKLSNKTKKISSKRKKISKGLREKVWIKYMKNRVQGKCYCCRIKPIHFTDFEVGHNKSVHAGGQNHITNLRPICRSCNREMGIKSIEWWRKKYYGEIKPKKKQIKKKTTKKKVVKKSLSKNYWINPLTGRKEKSNLFNL